MSFLKNYKYYLLSLKNSKIPTIIYTILKICEASIPAISSILLSKLINSLDSNIQIIKNEEVFVYLLFFILILLIEFIIRFVEKFIYKIIRVNLNKKLKRVYIKKISVLEYPHFENSESQDLIERIGDNFPDKVLNGLNNYMSLFEILFSLIGLMVVIASKSLIISTLCLLFLIPVIWISRKAGAKMYETDKEIAPLQRKSRYLRSLLNSRESSFERSVYRYESLISEKWQTVMEKKISLDYHADKTIFMRVKGISILYSLTIISLCILLIPLLKSGRMLIGGYISIIVIYTKFIHTISWQLPGLLNDFVKNYYFLDDIDKFMSLSERKNVNDIPADIFNTNIFTGVSIKNLYFRYPNQSNMILQDINLNIEPGVQYALIGKNGCGKSTLVKLIAGLYNTFEGKIQVNELNINNIPSNMLLELITLHYQSSSTYQLSLRDQIKLGNNNIGDMEIIDILKRFGLNKLVDDKNLLDTNIGKILEGGIDISGGQWQRLSLARSFAKGGRLLIFDEPASALDTFAEKSLYSHISDYCSTNTATSIYITHRLSTAKMSDCILLMDNGQIIASGSHDILLKNNPVYSEMYYRQKKWYDFKEEECRVK